MIGEKLGSLQACNAYQNTSYFRAGAHFLFGIKAMGNVPVASIDALIKTIPLMVKQKYFVVDVINAQRFGRPLEKLDLHYEDTMQSPMCYTFNPSMHIWEGKPIA